MFSSTIIPMPANDKDFEEKCVVLFAGLLNDPNVKMVGSRGMGQQGLDLLGARDRDPDKLVGVQCKLKTKGARLEEAEVRKEVGKALFVEPQLAEYYIVTTASDDTAMDLLSVTIRREQSRLGRQIDVQIWGWETLQLKIRSDLAASKAFDPGQSPAIDKLLELGTETQQTVLETSAKTHHAQEELLVLVKSMSGQLTSAPADSSRGSALEAHLDGLVDQYRSLINGGQPRTALDLLNTLEASLSENNSAAVRARVRANIGWATLRLGHDKAAGRLLAEAYDLHPSDPKLIANKVLSLIIADDFATAATFATEALAADSTNANVAGFLYQIAVQSDVIGDPTPLISPELLSDAGVQLHRISYVRAKGEPDAWRALAAEAFEAHPDEDSLKRMAAEAWFDQALASGAFERSLNLTADQSAFLEKAIDLFENLWEKTRKFENADQDYWVAVGVNLANAYRAKGDQESADRVCAQAVAIAPNDKNVLSTAFFLALERDDLDQALVHVRALDEGPFRSVQLLNVLSRRGEWEELSREATAERREQVGVKDQPAFDALAFRARVATGQVDLDTAATELLAQWPKAVGVHVIVADAFRRGEREKAEAVASKALALLDDDTNYGDRVMLAQLAVFLNDRDTVIRCLDLHLRLDRDSEPLLSLAWAFANTPPRPRTHAFFASLSPELLALPQYARLAGVAEATRGDLQAAERHLRVALTADLTDLRGQLQLHSVLRRQMRRQDAHQHVLEIVEGQQAGDAMDKMRLAHLLVREGASERGVALGYAVARVNRDRADVVASFQPLILMAGRLPPDVQRHGIVGPDTWFALEGPQGVVAGVVEDLAGAEHTFATDHPLAVAAWGRSEGESFELDRPLGPNHDFKITEVLHKYLWLMDDISRTFASRFPTDTSFISMTMQDGDVQPILDMAKQLDDHKKQIAQVYFEAPVPLAAIAAVSRKSIIEMAEQLLAADTDLRTCQGTLPERQMAERQARYAKGHGAVLDTLTVWTAYRLGLFEALKAYFGRLVIAQSTLDDFLELQAEHEAHSGGEVLSLGFHGDQPVRTLHTAEDTDRSLSTVEDLLAKIQTHFEVLPVDGAEDLRLDEAGSFEVDDFLDPVHLVRQHGLYLLSDDGHLRQLAKAYGAPRGGWLQIVCRALALSRITTETAYLISVAQLAALRHAHLWLDATILHGLDRLDDPRRDGLFQAAARYIGGPTADMESHTIVVADFMRHASRKGFGPKTGAAINTLIMALIKGQEHWPVVLLGLDQHLASFRGDRPAVEARQHLHRWVRGHFLNQAIASSSPSATGSRAAKRRRKRGGN